MRRARRAPLFVDAGARFVGGTAVGRAEWRVRRGRRDGPPRRA
ncbi:MAG: hypothetical protein AVDCRST_MAG39-1787 [uncultured Sphingomonadaceae bacterium]|uniref:Uncharacterized protein n=1 Tax=uncultured Sphingomonadaceae bacterium TaxID=169976 RepID=A0A6J4SWM9_9SPHN|nr:MAG: hypothetical protein AVDCRST_MAG39-1787 [uncultured Sphingomonadaceae bacterium]